MSIHLQLLVLVVTICCYRVTIGISINDTNNNNNIAAVTTTMRTSSSSSSSSMVLSNNSNNNYSSNSKQKYLNNNDDYNGKIIIDANSVVTSGEMQGATPKTKIGNSGSVQYNDNSSSNRNNNKNDGSLSSSEANVKESSNINLMRQKSERKESQNQNESKIKEEKFNHKQSQIPATTYRSSTRSNGIATSGATSSSQHQNRDNKLMSLLAARRSALQFNRFSRTHRRISATANSTAAAVVVDETTASSKNSSDPKTICERNCTKNFTRRGTASCMRGCITMHKVTITTTSTTTTTTTTATVSPSIAKAQFSSKTLKSPSAISSKTKTDEKDNNEILLTDESSHGFFVVTKELNDTVNHISTSDAKLIITSTEKNQKLKSKTKQQLSAEEIDMSPYVFFGRKLPPLKPTVLRISKVDDHPKVLEISVTKPTERNRGRVRYNPKDRNIVAYNRRHGLANITRNNIKTTTNKPVGLFRESSEEKLIKEATIEDDATITVLTRSAEKQIPLSRIVLDPNTTTAAINENQKHFDKIPQNLTSVTLVLENQSTPLIINVPENDELTTITTPTVTKATEPPKIQPKPFLPYHVPAEEKSNLIIFVNATTTPKPSTTTTVTTTRHPRSTTTHRSPTSSYRPPSTTSYRPSSTTNYRPTSTTPSTTSSTSSTSTTTTTEKVPLVFSTVETFTRTTISSSVRSTVNPKSVDKTPISTSTTSTTASPFMQSTSTLPSKSQTQHTPLENTTYTLKSFPNISRNQVKTTSVPATSDVSVVEGSVIPDSEVTIEMQRINMATYVLAGLGMFPLVIIILYVGKTLIFKRRMKDDSDLDHCMNDEQPITPVRKMDQCDDDRNDQYSITSDQEFDRSNIRFKSLLGEGNFGQVWKAEADDLSGHMGTTRIVAIKTVRAGSSQNGLKEEAMIMRKLGSHPNVVTLLGACIETEPHLLIMEYAMRGRLLSLLRAARSATNILPASVPGGRSLAPLSPRTLAGFALDIARGMEYISDRKIVHRDLAARNVLLDHNGVCKICDFGMSIDLEARKVDVMRNTSALENRFRFDFGGRLINHWSNINSNNNNNNINNNNNNSVNQINHEKKHQHDSINKRPALPIRWMAPEALQYHIFSPETDVWAFGILLWEIATLGCTPYPNLSGREVIRCVPNGVRPDPPKDGRSDYWDLMCRCWKKNPRDRPTFREARIEISRSLCKWIEDDTSNSDYMDVSGFSEDLEHGMVYFNRRISEFECEI